MSVNREIDAALARLTLAHREENYRHHSYSEDMHQYELIRQGDPEAISVGKAMFEGPTTGSLSDDPLKNYQYLFVASITLACRFCIEGGMSSEEAFNLSDLYIRRLDKCQTKEAVFDLHDTMFRDYVTRMQHLERTEIYSKQIHRCMDYIDQHLQSPLTVELLAGELSVSRSYLSTLFQKETGRSVSEYIRDRRIETAKKLLTYTDFSCLEIAEYLCFSSDSHFSRTFREVAGESPSQFRKKHYKKHFAAPSGKA
ncbi:MAG: helix-turn-helix transcriptional regulator [Clostridia bacterium]|nr:helix-turn-helix transcriptional regulator [Clostridia bacterium]